MRTLLLLTCLLLAACQGGYHGAITIGYTTTLPDGKSHTFGLSVPLSIPAKAPAAVPLIPDAKGAQTVLP